MGCIAIEGMEFYSAIGYYQQEKNIKGRFTVDVYVDVSLEAAAIADDLNKTLNYELIYQFCQEIMHEEFDLLETAALQMLKKIKDSWPDIDNVRVRVSKWDPPLKGPSRRTYVELENTNL